MSRRQQGGGRSTKEADTMKRRLAALAACATLMSGGIAVAAATPASANSTCTYTQGYYKNHVAYLGSRLDISSLTFNTQQAVTTFFGVPNTAAGLVTIYTTAPKGGDANLIAAHQFITAAANGTAGEVGDFGSPALNQAFYGLHDYFFGQITLTRDQLVAYAALLDQYNNGLLTLPHCG